MKKLNMKKEDFILEVCDLDNLSGHAVTSCDSTTSALNELEIIRQACRSQSEQMPKGYKVEPDGHEVRTHIKRDDSGQSVTNIRFGFELKTDD